MFRQIHRCLPLIFIANSESQWILSSRSFPLCRVNAAVQTKTNLHKRQQEPGTTAVVFSFFFFFFLYLFIIQRDHFAAIPRRLLNYLSTNLNSSAKKFRKLYAFRRQVERSYLLVCIICKFEGETRSRFNIKVFCFIICR